MKCNLRILEIGSHTQSQSHRQTNKILSEETRTNSQPRVSTKTRQRREKSRHLSQSRTHIIAQSAQCRESCGHVTGARRAVRLREQETHTDRQTETTQTDRNTWTDNTYASARRSQRFRDTELSGTRATLSVDATQIIIHKIPSHFNFSDRLRSSQFWCAHRN